MTATTTCTISTDHILNPVADNFHELSFVLISPAIIVERKVFRLHQLIVLLLF